MGVSQDLQYMIPLTLVMLLCKFFIIRLNKDNCKKYVFIGLITYGIVKVALLNYFNYNKNLIALTIFMIAALAFFLYLEFYVIKKNREKNYQELLAEIKVGYLYGIGLILFPILIIIFDLNLYGGEMKNYYLLSFESFLSGIIFLIVSDRGIKIISARAN